MIMFIALIINSDIHISYDFYLFLIYFGSSSLPNFIFDSISDRNILICW